MLVTGRFYVVDMFCCEIFGSSYFARFTEKLLKALKGGKGLVEPSYVYLPGVPGGKEIAEKTGVDFFSVPIELGV